MNKEKLDHLNKQGARSIVRDYLKLRKEELFLIISDETTREIADYVKAEAEASEAEVEVIEVNTDQQARIKNRRSFPSTMAEKISKAQCILNILDSKPECTVFRKLILKEAQGFGKRIAHAPGLRVEHLSTVFQANFTEMLRWNNILFRLLYFAKECVIITKSKQNTPYELRLNLGGKERMPTQSTQVMDGSWTNIPGAEVFIAPIEREAYGEIIINGSMLSCVLTCDVHLTFKNGKIESWKAMDNRFQEVLDNFAPKWEHDPDWSCLCEFGIGLNNAFKAVTGSQLLDEKMGGTCHIAIGSNKEFGGKIESEIHQDFVTITPTIIVDGKLIMKDGAFTIDENDVYENLEHLAISEEKFVGQEFRLTVRNMEEEDGKVGIALLDGNDQPFFFQVGNDKSSQKILEVLNNLEATPEFSYNEFKTQYEQAPAIISLLLNFDFIEYKND